MRDPNYTWVTYTLNFFWYVSVPGYVLYDIADDFLTPEQTRDAFENWAHDEFGLNVSSSGDKVPIFEDDFCVSVADETTVCYSAKGEFYTVEPDHPGSTEYCRMYAITAVDKETGQRLMQEHTQCKGLTLGWKESTVTITSDKPFCQGRVYDLVPVIKNRGDDDDDDDEEGCFHVRGLHTFSSKRLVPRFTCAFADFVYDVACISVIIIIPKQVHKRLISYIAMAYKRTDHFRPLLRQYLRVHALQHLESRVMVRYFAVEEHVNNSDRRNMLPAHFLIPQLVAYEHWDAISFGNRLTMSWWQTWEPVRLALNWPRDPKAKFSHAAKRIQAAFRLWSWRKKHVWNPHTYIGQLNAQIKARVSARQG